MGLTAFQARRRQEAAKAAEKAKSEGDADTEPTKEDPPQADRPPEGVNPPGSENSPEEGGDAGPEVVAPNTEGDKNAGDSVEVPAEAVSDKKKLPKRSKAKGNQG